MEETDFSLRDLIASMEAEAGPDPHDIAAKVEPLIPESERHAIFLMLLARFISQSTRRLTDVLEAARPAPPSSAKSAKVAAYREYAQFLRLNVNVAPGQRKWMEDCTHEDLTFAALNRREHAARSEAAAAQYEELAALLKRHKAPTVGKLPTSALDKFLRRDRGAAA